MATTWYKDLGIGDYGSKMRVRVNAIRQDRAGNYTRVRVRIYAYNGSSYSRTYNLGTGAAVAISGDASYSGRQTFDIGPGEWAALVDREFNVGHDADGRKSFSITGSLSDTGTSALGNGGSITVTGTFDPLYLAPTTPSWGSTDYQDPDRVQVRWTNRGTARGAYSSIRVQRWDDRRGWYAHRAVLSGSATSYTDTALTDNNEHFWRVRAEGPGGNSGWVRGGTLGTTPAAATDVQAAKADQGIRVSWTDNAAPTNRTRTFIIEDNPDGTGWVQVGTVGGSGESWAHTDADPSRTHQYRVTAQITSQITLTSSPSAASATVQLQAPPQYPTLISPEGGAAVDEAVPVAFEWEHNPVDTTQQTAAQLQWRTSSGTWNVIDVSGSQQSVTESMSVAEWVAIEWQVRTKGEHPDWGPWSPVDTFTLSTTPIVVVQSPTDTVAVSRLTVDWTYQAGGSSSPLDQAGWELRLTDWATGTPLERAAGSTETSVQLDTRLLNDTEYLLWVRVRNGHGLWSEPVTVRFVTGFPVPAEVTAVPSWDRSNGSVSVGFQESQELRAFHRWTGDANASTSEQYLQDTAQAVDLTDMVVNGDLADGATAWDGSTRFERVQVVGPGDGSMFDWALTATRAAQPYTGGLMPTSAGQEYVFEMWLRADLPGSHMYMDMRDGDGNHQGYVLSDYEVPTEWTHEVVRYTLPDGVGAARIGAFLLNHANGTEQGAQLWFTGFRFYPASAADEGVIAENLVNNPRPHDLTGYSATGDFEHVIEDGEPAILVTEDTDARYDLFVHPADIPANIFAVGNKIYFAVEVKVQQRIPRMKLLLGGTGELAGTNFSSVEVDQVPSDGWVRHSLTATVTAAPDGGGFRPMVRPEGGSLPVGDSYMVRRYQVERNTSNPYFDGDSVDVTDVDATDVERRDEGGDWVLIASGIPTSTTITDRTPRIGSPQYRAVSRTTLPTETEGPAVPAPWVHDRDPVYVSGGDDWGQVCLARGAEASDARTVDQALHRFAGQAQPTAFFGPGEDYTTTFTGKVYPHYHLPVSGRDEWVALLRERGLVLFRDCQGRKVYGVLSVDFATSRNVDTVNISVQQARYVEGVARVSDAELQERMGP